MENQTIGASGASYYMAGAACWANTHDIRGNDWSDTDKRRPGMRVTTYVLDVNSTQQTPQSVHKQNQYFLAAKLRRLQRQRETGNPYKARTTRTRMSTGKHEHPRRREELLPVELGARVLSALDEIFANIAKGRTASPAARSRRSA